MLYPDMLQGDVDEVFDIRVVVSLGTGRSPQVVNDPSEPCKLEGDMDLPGPTDQLAHEVSPSSLSI